MPICDDYVFGKLFATYFKNFGSFNEPLNLYNS